MDYWASFSKHIPQPGLEIRVIIHGHETQERSDAILASIGIRGGTILVLSEGEVSVPIYDQSIWQYVHDESIKIDTSFLGEDWEEE